MRVDILGWNWDFNLLSPETAKEREIHLRFESVLLRFYPDWKRYRAFLYHDSTLFQDLRHRQAARKATWSCFVINSEYRDFSNELPQETCAGTEDRKDTWDSGPLLCDLLVAFRNHQRHSYGERRSDLRRGDR